MIARLTGRVVERGEDRIILDVNGVGYEVFAPASTLRKSGPAGSPLTLHTVTHVREDALQLFGFATADEKGLFESVTGISGIGPRLGLAILSSVSPDDFRRAVRENNVAILTAIGGVGRKTAQRIIVDLRDRYSAEDDLPGDGPASSFQDAVTALVTLGYPRPTAVKAVRRAVGGLDDQPAVEDVVRRALGEIAAR